MQRYDRERENGGTRQGVGYVENYTVPFLWSAGFLCFIMLYAIWSVWGYPVALLVPYLIHRIWLRPRLER